MTSSELSGQKNEERKALVSRLENIGKQEIYVWKEMVLSDKTLFPEIYRLIYCDNPRIAWHAAWVIDHVSEAEPAMLTSCVPELINHLGNLTHDSLKRHFTRMLLRQPIPENQLGLLVNLLYDLLSPSEAVAVRANAMQLLYNISKKEPDLQNEFRIVLTALLEDECSPGIRSKGRNLLRSLGHQ